MQTIRTLAYQLDLTLKTLLTTHKKATPAMMNLLDAWKLAMPQKELDEIWMILMEIQNYETLGMCPPVRATGHQTPGESSVILQSVVMIQLTSRRILRD